MAIKINIPFSEGGGVVNKMKNFDYHFKSEANQYSFFQIPKDLVIDPYFSGLSTDAKMLYGFMLDRMSLSRKNGWIDKDNRVYIIFTMVDCMEVFNCGKDKSLKLFNELKKYKLIKQIKQGQGKPALIYVCNIHKELSDELEKGVISLPQTSENAEVKSSADIKVKTSENTEVKTSENAAPNYTNNNYTYNNYTDYQSNQSSCKSNIIGRTNEDMMDEEVENFLIAFREKIDINIYLSVYPDDEECLFDIIDIMGSSLAALKLINFAGRKYQRKEIMIFLYKLTSDYMHDLVCKYKKIKVSDKIKNKKKYMFAVILDTAFNMPVNKSLPQKKDNFSGPPNAFMNYTQRDYTEEEISGILARKQQKQNRTYTDEEVWELHKKHGLRLSGDPQHKTDEQSL